MSDTAKKIEAMEAMLGKLENVYNSQKTLNEQIAAIQIELFDAPDPELDDAVGQAVGNAQRNAELIRAAADKFQMKLNALKAQ